MDAVPPLNIQQTCKRSCVPEGAEKRVFFQDDPRNKMGREIMLLTDLLYIQFSPPPSLPPPLFCSTNMLHQAVSWKYAYICAVKRNRQLIIPPMQEHSSPPAPDA